MLGTQQPRVFQVKGSWVRQGPEKLNELFRRVNRAQPVPVKIRGLEAVLIANSQDGVVAYETRNGRELWRISVEKGVEATPAVFENTVFVGDLAGNMGAYDLESGELVWIFATKAEQLSEPVVTERMVYFLSGANTLFALDRPTGRQVWSHSRQDSNASSIRAGSRPVIKNGFVYSGFSDGAIVCLTESNGQVKWEQNLNKGVRFRDMDSDLVLHQDQLYAMGFDDAFYALKPSTGDVIWKIDVGGWSRPAVVGDAIYFASTRSSVLSIERTSGKILWEHNLSQGIATAPIATESGLIVFGESQGELKFLDRGTGKLLAAFDPGRGVLSQPLVLEKTRSVLFVSGEANIYAVQYGWGRPDPFPYLR